MSGDWSKFLAFILVSFKLFPTKFLAGLLSEHPKTVTKRFNQLNLHSFSRSTKLRVEIHFERRAENRNTSTRKRQGTKARDIRKLYPKDKADALIKKLHERGLWYWDPDFENDEEDCWGLIKCRIKCVQSFWINSTSTSLTSPAM